ncbi:hypothetical protein OAP09_03235 [Acidimicrobiia bacterium]|nr:hypothetical protein [Acidimicrobiia bacterium]MDC0595680.1 hypothetical protein [Acidimicrobiia bacterium]
MSSYEDRMSEKYGFFGDNKKMDTDEQTQISQNEDTQESQVSGENNLIVPLEAWQTVLNQLGNLHEANQLMAEARERAAKAEAEAEFLREKLKNTREQLDTASKKKKFFFF